MSAHARLAVILAAGTGGHVFPALALARELRLRGWRILWIGAGGMEARIVPKEGMELRTQIARQLRASGWLALLLMPVRLLLAWLQALLWFIRLRPDLVIGFGGYVTPAPALAAKCLCVPLMLHEQNARAGLANRALAPFANCVMSSFPDALPRARLTGNPLRAAFLHIADPAQRYAGRNGAGRNGPLRVLVVGGSQGAAGLNQCLPRALSLLMPAERPRVLHQTGAGKLQATLQAYAAANIAARTTAGEVQCVEFIDDMALALSEADIVLSRAGAGAVMEIAAVGVASLLIPYPYAADDHQAANAAHLVRAGAAWAVAQKELTPALLANMMRGWTREKLLGMALKARALAKTNAASEMARHCEALLVLRQRQRRHA